MTRAVPPSTPGPGDATMRLPDYDVAQGVAIIAFTAVPGTAMSAALAAGIGAQLDRAIADPEVGAAVLVGQGRVFSTGAGATGPEAETVLDAVARLAAEIEAAPKPVVAALNGAAAGPGLELALACHGRTAARGVALSFPQIALGLPPGAGATQRLPRLVGAEAALRMLSGGRAVRAEAAPAGLIDAVAEGDPAVDAAALARRLAAAPAVPTSARREGLADPRGFMAACAAARRAPGPIPAARALPDCVEAALLLPFAAGLEMERAHWRDCRATPEAQALIHLTRAEAEAALPPPGAAAAEVARLGIVGATPRGAAWAIAALEAGIETVLVATDAPGLAQVTERILAAFDRAVEAGRLDRAAADLRLSRLVPAERFEALEPVDLALLALSDDLTLQREGMGALGLLTRPEAVLATTAALSDLDALAAASGRPGAVVAMHTPERAGRLCEVAATADTDPSALATALSLTSRVGMTAVAAGAAPGLILGPLREAGLQAVEAMLLQGVPPDRLDAALVAWGLDEGPCRALDVEGLDRRQAQRRALGAARGRATVLDVLVEAGRVGRRAGGFYTPEGAVSDEAVALVAALAEMSGVAERRISEPGIVRRWTAALANAGARAVEAGTAPRPGAVDVCAHAGLGFPRWRGGPMVAADLRGLLRVQNDLRRYAEEGEVFAPAPLFAELIKNGQHFGDL
ncbi:hypothetical protein DXV76_05870 [Rhodobacteraceae bacterium CCMM004]|nr:hypothetical protein DXV76_05870 [Rhodobacteraceae bacterium CCMM004]